MKTLIYIKREIKTIEDLPKEYGKYFVFVKNSGIDIYEWCQIIKGDAIAEYYENEEQKDLWLNTFNWYLQPIELELPDGEEIMDTAFHYGDTNEEDSAFYGGAKWLRDKIIEQLNIKK